MSFRYLRQLVDEFTQYLYSLDDFLRVRFEEATQVKLKLLAQRQLLVAADLRVRCNNHAQMTSCDVVPVRQDSDINTIPQKSTYLRQTGF